MKLAVEANTHGLRGHARVEEPFADYLAAETGAC